MIAAVVVKRRLRVFIVCLYHVHDHHMGMDDANGHGEGKRCGKGKEGKQEVVIVTPPEEERIGYQMNLSRNANKLELPLPLQHW
jgi:hypothetical protein